MKAQGTLCLQYTFTKPLAWRLYWVSTETYISFPFSIYKPQNKLYHRRLPLVNNDWNTTAIKKTITYKLNILESTIYQHLDWDKSLSGLLMKVNKQHTPSSATVRAFGFRVWRWLGRAFSGPSPGFPVDLTGGATGLRKWDTISLWFYGVKHSVHGRGYPLYRLQVKTVNVLFANFSFRWLLIIWNFILNITLMKVLRCRFQSTRLRSNIKETKPDKNSNSCNVTLYYVNREFLLNIYHS